MGTEGGEDGGPVIALVMAPATLERSASTSEEALGHRGRRRSRARHGAGYARAIGLDVGRGPRITGHTITHSIFRLLHSLLLSILFYSYSYLLYIMAFAGQHAPV